LAKHLKEDSDARLLTAYGTLYRALTRLEEMGLLVSRWEDPKIPARENRPGRRLYSLTAKGETVAKVQSAEVRAKPTTARNRKLRPA
jgi:DNA-binding PadR family transcriptional regulator